MEKELLLPAFDLTDKVAVVTGSSKGLGKWIAMGLAQAGADVLVTYCSSKSDGEDTCEQISALGRKTCLVRVDVSEVDSIEAMVQTAVEELGGLDIMVNNAGISIRKLALEVTPEEYDSVAQVNQKGTYFGCQFAARVMAERGGGEDYQYGFRRCLFGAKRALSFCLCHDQGGFGYAHQGPCSGVGPPRHHR